MAINFLKKLFPETHDKKAFFPVLPEGDIMEVVDLVQELHHHPSIDGILDVCVVSGPDRVRVIFDEDRVDEKAIKQWLVASGIPLV